MRDDDDDLHLLLARPGGAPALPGPLRADGVEEAPPGIEPEYLWEEGDDPNSLPAQRWGVIAPMGPDGDRLLARIAPLVALRREQQGAEPAVFRVPPKLSPAEAHVWRKRVFEDQGGLREDLPRFLLLLGDLDQVPLSLQHAFAGDGFPGRLCFPTDDGYAAYVDKVLRWERAAAAERAEGVVCGVRDRTPANELAERGLLGPGLELLEAARDRGALDATLARLDLGDDPSPDPLLARAAATGPTVLFSASHGEGPPPGGWPRDADARARQGAMCLGRHALTATDLATRPFLPGGAWCMLACYGAGTPDASVYHRWLAELAAAGRYYGRPDDVLPRPGARPFVAALPQAALANPGGPLAFIGHVDLAWSYGFQDLDGRTVSRPGRLIAGMRGLLRGDRAGVAMRELARGVGMANAEITCLEEESAHVEMSRAERVRRAHLWMLRHDLAAYILLGDPAARLPLAARDAPSWQLPSEPDPALHVQAAAPAPAVDPALLDRVEALVVRHLAGEPLDVVAADAAVSRDALTAAVDAYRTAARAALARHLAGE